MILESIALLGVAWAVSKKGNTLSEKRLYDLADIDPAEQGGSWKRDFDLYMQAAADETGVPFALIKGHAIMESSLNPRAFRDENPSNREDRQGWASRGLMQLLFWPGSTRFAKYGFPASSDPENLFDPNTNVRIGAKLIADNLKACNGNLRDAINMYNTGKKESQYQAPYDYVNRVLKNYQTLIGEI